MISSSILTVKDYNFYISMIPLILNGKYPFRSSIGVFREMKLICPYLEGSHPAGPLAHDMLRVESQPAMCPANTLSTVAIPPSSPRFSVGVTG